MWCRLESQEETRIRRGPQEGKNEGNSNGPQNKQVVGLNKNKIKVQTKLTLDGRPLRQNMSSPLDKNPISGNGGELRKEGNQHEEEEDLMDWEVSMDSVDSKSRVSENSVDS